MRYSNKAIIFFAKYCYCFSKSAEITMNQDFQFTWRKKYCQENVFLCNSALSFYRNIARQNRSSDKGLSNNKLRLLSDLLYDIFFQSNECSTVHKRISHYLCLKNDFDLKSAFLKAQFNKLNQHSLPHFLISL